MQTLTIALAAVLAPCALLAADDAPQPEDLFRTLDADNDGTLSADEIGEAQRQAFERLLRVGDADKDGRLTREEYLEGFQPDPPTGVNPRERARGPGRDGRPQRPDFGRLFDIADRDGDGMVAPDDLPARARERMRPLFERLGNGQLTREDFERLGRQQRSGSRQAPGEDRRLFERFDANGDARLTRDEIPALLRRRFEAAFQRLDKKELTREDFQQTLRQQSGEPQTERGPGGAMDAREDGQPLTALGRLLDADGDGQLTTTEIESLYDDFDELDADGDDKLSGAELRAFIGRKTSREGRRPAESRAAENSRPRRPKDNPRGSQ